MKAPNAVQKLNRVTFGLTVQLLIAFLFVGGFVIMAEAWDVSAGVRLLLAAALGLLLTYNLQRTLRVLSRALVRLRHALPLTDLPRGFHRPLNDLIAGVNELAEQQRPLADMHQTLIRQTSEAAAQEERNRLARELHDSIKQQIFSIQISAAAVEARWHQDEEGAKRSLADVRQSAKEAIVEMNALLQQLSPAPLEKVGLVQALRDQCEALEYRAGADVKVRIGDLPDDADFPLGAQEAIFRIAQEALSNVARHARADNVFFHLRQNKRRDRLLLSIIDDGKGYDTGAMSSGMGLVNMRQRLTPLNGKMRVESALGQGTRLYVAIPLSESMIFKEPVPATQQDYSVSRLFATGIGGGVLLLALMYYPLYILWPGQFVTGWRSGSQVLGFICQFAALLTAVGTGFIAARWIDVRSRLGGTFVGGLAGSVAGAILFYGLGGAAAGMLGAAHIWPPAAARADEGLRMVETIIETVWWTYSTFWILLLMGAGLGAMGGSLVSPERRPDDERRKRWRLVVQHILAAVVVVNVMAVLVGQTVYGLLWPQVKSLAAGLEDPLIVGGFIFWPIFTPIAFYLASLAAAYILLRAESRTRSLDRVTFAYLHAVAYTFFIGVGLVGHAILLVGGRMWFDLGWPMRLFMLLSLAIPGVFAGLFVRLAYRSRRAAFKLGLRRPAAVEKWMLAGVVLLLGLTVLLWLRNSTLAAFLVLIDALILLVVYWYRGGRDQLTALFDTQIPLLSTANDAFLGGATAVAILLSLAVPAALNLIQFVPAVRHTLPSLSITEASQRVFTPRPVVRMVESAYIQHGQTLLSMFILALVITGLSLMMMRGVLALGRRQLRSTAA